MKIVFSLLLVISMIGNIVLAKLYFYPAKPVEKKQTKKEKPLEKYQFDHLQKQNFPASKIEIGKRIRESDNCVSSLFYYWVQGKRVSGLLNTPKDLKTHPVLILVRGYVDQEIYETGIGTQHFGEEACGNGFVTLAPDFLGYGASDMPSNDPLEERFQTYPTILTLLASVADLNRVLNSNTPEPVDSQKIGIWGHSNGGQIALSALEISEKDYPTVLWAPVTKPFPFSILYFTDEADDHGKALRKLVSGFEALYDAEKYSVTSFISSIRAPIQLHQGGKDEAVPQAWSDQFVKALKDEEKEVDYFTYSGDDHNFSQGSWQTVADRSIAFFKEKLKD